MTDYDPNTRTTVNVDAAHTTPGQTIDVRRSGSAMPWVLAAIVAVVAIIAVAFLMTGRTDPTQDDIADAMDTSRAAGYVEGATSAMTAGAGAATMAADRTAAEASAAAADARAAAERAATSASDAAADAADRATDEVIITEPVQ